MGFGKSYGKLDIIMAKNKKGQEGGGFSWITGIIMLLFSAGAILFVLSFSSAKVDEKTQVDLCRVSNEIKVGVEHRTKEIVSTPRFCSAIDKTSGMELIPTKNYPQDINGAKTEIRDMIKNCWYMWLEGSEPNIFRLFPEEQSCRICYNFKIKDMRDKKGNPAEFKPIELVEKMQEPYFASDTSDKCNPPNGGYLRNNEKCEGASPSDREQDPEGKEAFEKMVSGKFCCRRELINECYNKGGKCLENPSPPHELPYTKWACPAEKNCYVEGKNMVSYMEYIVEYQREGEFIIEDQDPGKPIEDITYPKDKKYTISFISPAKKCTNAGCKVFSFVEQSVVGPPLDVIKIVGNIGIPGVKKGVRSIIEMSNPFSEYPPNKIMLSTYDKAKEKGCREE